MTDKNHIEDADERAVWKLLGRHQAIEPSFGFAQRTLRRLHELPAARRRFWEQPVFRWAFALGLVLVIAASAAARWRQIRVNQRVEIYAAARQDSLEDFDVIAALDQLTGETKL